MKKFLALGLAMLLIAALFAGCQTQAPAPSPSADQPNPEQSSEPTPPENKIKVACLFSGSVSDAGWNQDGYEAMVAMSKEYGFDFSHQENVSASDAPDALRNYASEGYNLVLSGEQYHSEAVAEVAAEFPDVTFGVANGYMGASNLIAITGSNWQASALGGVLASGMTTSGKIGILTATDSEAARIMVAGFTKGAKTINENIDITHSYVGSFNDTVKGMELVNAMIEKGIDVILTNAGQSNTGTVEACKNAGIYCIGAIVDMASMAPDTVLASAMLPPSGLLRIIVEGYLDGSLTGSEQAVKMGLKEGAEKLQLNPALQDKIPDDVLTKIAEVETQIIDGTFVATID